LDKKIDFNYVQFATVGAALAGLCGLMGYIPGLNLLGSINSIFIPMAPSTSISFIFMATALFVYNRKDLKVSFQYLVLILTVLTTLFGLLEVIGFFIDKDLTLEDRLVPDFGELAGIPIARMSPSTGALFFLSGIALLLLFQNKGHKAFQKKWSHLSGFFSSLVLMSAATFLLGYLYGTPLLYDQKIIPMALTTAIGFGFLSVGTTLAVGVNFFPLNQVYGTSTRAQLMKAFLPLVFIIILAHDFTSKFLNSYFNTNTALLSATLIIISFVITGIIINGISKVVGSKIDRLEQIRMKNETELRESENKFRSIFENSPLAIVHFDKSGITTDCNDNLCEMLGSSKDKLIGLDTLSKIKDKKMISAIYGALNGEKTQYEGEYKSVTGEKTTPINANFAPILSGNRTVLGAIGILEDITDRVAVQKERTMLEKQLQQSQKIESIGTLAGGIAHEFNNILSIIIGNNELIMKDLPEWSLSKESCEEIRLAGIRARDVVKHLLTFSRKDYSNKKPIDIASVTIDALKLVRSTTPSNIKIRDRISPDCWPIFGDSTQIHQILINLCNNAVDALPISGGEIDIELCNLNIEKSKASSTGSKKPGKYVRLIVRDNGSGMDTKTLERVFEPYFTTKDVGKGSGIGLSVVHGIVENHNGSITCESSKAQGTEFTIYIPAYEGRVEEKSAKENILPGKGECVLYVDDEPSIAKLGRRHLKSLGYDAYSTTDPKEALEMVKAEPNRFNLVISDMAMPNMPGDQLISEILSINPEMLTMICSGYSSRMSETKASEMGIKAFVMKPLDITELAKKVREVLNEGNQIIK